MCVRRLCDYFHHQDRQAHGCSVCLTLISGGNMAAMQQDVCLKMQQDVWTLLCLSVFYKQVSKLLAWLTLTSPEVNFNSARLGHRKPMEPSVRRHRLAPKDPDTFSSQKDKVGFQVHCRWCEIHKFVTACRDVFPPSNLYSWKS